jgi:hypothetical protein
MAASQIRMRSNLSSEMQRKKKNATLLQVALHFFLCLPSNVSDCVCNARKRKPHRMVWFSFFSGLHSKP